MYKIAFAINHNNGKIIWFMSLKYPTLSGLYICFKCLHAQVYIWMCQQTFLMMGKSSNLHQPWDLKPTKVNGKGFQDNIRRANYSFDSLHTKDSFTKMFAQFVAKNPLHFFLLAKTIRLEVIWHYLFHMCFEYCVKFGWLYMHIFKSISK